MNKAVTIGITILLLLAAGCSSQPPKDDAGGESTRESTVSRSGGDAEADIVGNWIRITAAEGEIWTTELEFLKDGTVVFGKSGSAANYSFPEEGRIKFEGPDLIQVYRFSTSVDKLTFDDGFEATYQRMTMRLVTMWGTQGSAAGQFSSPGGIAVDGSGNVYVTDTGNDRVQKFTSDGEFLTMWGSEGNSAGQFSVPPVV